MPGYSDAHGDKDLELFNRGPKPAPEPKAPKHVAQHRPNSDDEYNRAPAIIERAKQVERVAHAITPILVEAPAESDAYPVHVTVQPAPEEMHDQAA